MEQVRPVIDEVTPDKAFEILRDQADSALIDVRSRAEWAFVGQPDLTGVGRELWSIEWAAYPTMARNADFADEVLRRTAGAPPGRLLFICRSGARSMAAAQAIAAALAERGLAAACTNVAEGFEGDLDRSGHRGQVNGWKVRGLPWRQS